MDTNTIKQQVDCSDRHALHRDYEMRSRLVPAVRRVLELRLGGAQAAVKKIDPLLQRARADGRVRSAFCHHGASTGRWTGEGLQPQNLKRSTVADLDAAIAAVSSGDYEHVRSLYPRPVAVVGDCSWPMICAAPSHVFIRRASLVNASSFQRFSVARSTNCATSMIEPALDTWADTLSRPTKERAQRRPSKPEHIETTGGAFGAPPFEVNRQCGCQPQDTGREHFQCMRSVVFISAKFKRAPAGGIRLR